MIKYFLNDGGDLSFATPGSSGLDLRAAIGLPREIAPGERWLFPTGLYLEMPIGVMEAQVRSRSGLAIHHGVIVLNAPGTIDADYRGEVKVSLINLGRQSYIVNPGDRIAQLVFVPIFKPDIYQIIRVSTKEELSDTERGSGGHGSTGN